MDIVLFHSIWTIALLAIFIGIVAWAWSGKRKSSFDEAAHLPLNDDKHDTFIHRGGRHHG